MCVFHGVKNGRLTCGCTNRKRSSFATKYFQRKLLNFRPSSGAEKVSIVCGMNNHVKVRCWVRHIDTHTHTHRPSTVTLSAHARQGLIISVRTLRGGCLLKGDVLLGAYVKCITWASHFLITFDEVHCMFCHPHSHMKNHLIFCLWMCNIPCFLTLCAVCSHFYVPLFFHWRWPVAAWPMYCFSIQQPTRSRKLKTKTECEIWFSPLYTCIKDVGMPRSMQTR